MLDKRIWIADWITLFIESILILICFWVGAPLWLIYVFAALAAITTFGLILNFVFKEN